VWDEEFTEEKRGLNREITPGPRLGEADDRLLFLRERTLAVSLREPSEV
jgi:hypothetical protein